MKRLALVLCAAMAVGTMAMAQSDVLGVHNCYGRGCIACHTPHSGAAGNGEKSGGGEHALWGQNLTPLYGRTVTFGSRKAHSVVSLPASASSFADAKDPNFAIIACLSCHDGTIAKAGLMKGLTVEPLPVVGGMHPPY